MASDSAAGTRSWIRLRQDLYEQVQNHVNALLGRTEKTIQEYQKEYEREFRRNWRTSSRDDLLDALRKAQVIWMGDFHALQQSQKTQLRILKNLTPLEKRRAILAVECIEARHQKQLDQYLQSKITEREFLKSVEWKKNWGFPWENYKPLFRWAQKNKVPVFALNLRPERGDLRSLKERDRFSGQIILEILRRHPNHQLYVVYGDLHLATRHLPTAVEKVLPPEKSLFIFQNSERIYFQLLKKEIEHQVDVVKLSSNRFCLMSVPPWVKWQNYLLYLEQQYDREVDSDLDLTDYVARYVKVISEDLGVSVSTDHFTLVTPNEREAWAQIQRGLQNKDLKAIQHWIEAGRSFFIPQVRVAYLGRASVNSAAQLAMAIVSADLSGQKRLCVDVPEDFLKLIWIEAVQYFGSKMINPKRKSDTLSDIRAALQARNPLDRGKEALQLALRQKMEELMHLRGLTSSSAPMRVRQKKAYFEAARLLGAMLGEKVYHAYRRRLLSKPNLLLLLKKPVESAEFSKIYWGILEVVDHFPEPFISKNEKI